MTNISKRSTEMYCENNDLSLSLPSNWIGLGVGLLVGQNIIKKVVFSV